MRLSAVPIALGILIIIVGIVLSVGYLPGVLQDQTIRPDYDRTLSVPASFIFVSGGSGTPKIGDAVRISLSPDVNFSSIVNVTDLQAFQTKERGAPLFYGCLGAYFILGIAVLGFGIIQLRKARRKTSQTIDY